MSKLYEALRKSDEERRRAREAAQKDVPKAPPDTPSPPPPPIPPSAGRSTAFEREDGRQPVTLPSLDRFPRGFWKSVSRVAAAVQGTSSRPVRVCMLVGVERGVGTTTLALATAYVLVRDPGVEVLLIDAQARQEGSVILPGLEPGLIQLGRGLAKPAEVVFPTDHGGLHYLPRGSGSYNGPKLFEQLAPTFDEMRRRFDYVILDAAPMVIAPESAYLARLCEGVVVVLASERTPKPEAIRVRELLDENGARVIGTALNRARRSSLFGRR